MIKIYRKPNELAIRYSPMVKYFFSVFFLLIAAASYSQNTGSYLIPRTVFVGDPAALVLPLPGLKTEAADIILTPGQPGFPSDPNIDFHRIVFERRVSGSRLLIEFTAFVTGYLELPVIEAGGEQFSGLGVTIGSIIEQSKTGLELSAPASSIAMPGTAVMIFFTITSFVLITAFTIWFALKGRRYLQGFIKKWKIWQLFILMRNTEKRLHRALLKGANSRLILDKLSDAFRSFLSFITGKNCRTMTAREFETLSAEPEHGPQNKDSIPDIDFSFLGGFFRRCDNLRFSGRIAVSNEILPLLDDLRFFLDKLQANMKSNAPKRRLS